MFDVFRGFKLLKDPVLMKFSHYSIEIELNKDPYFLWKEESEKLKVLPKDVSEVVFHNSTVTIILRSISKHTMLEELKKESNKTFNEYEIIMNEEIEKNILEDKDLKCSFILDFRIRKELDLSELLSYKNNIEKKYIEFFEYLDEIDSDIDTQIDCHFKFDNQKHNFKGFQLPPKLSLPSSMLGQIGNINIDGISLKIQESPLGITDLSFFSRPKSNDILITFNFKIDKPSLILKSDNNFIESINILIDSEGK